MGNHTVNEKEEEVVEIKKEEYTEGGAGYKEDASITIMMFHPELIRFMSDHDKKREGLKLVEDKDILYQTEEYVAVKAFRNEKQINKNQKTKTKSESESEHEI